MGVISDALFRNNKWILQSIESNLKIEGQFALTDLTENLAAEYAEIKTIGRQVPILQYLGGEPRTYTFTARVFAQHQGILGLLADDISEIVENIRGLVLPNDRLGRPEVFNFSVGDVIEMSACVVKSVGGVSYDRLRPYDGTFRGVTFNITIQEFEEYNTNLSPSGNESLVLAFRQDEAFENIAFRVYGDANAGEPLRRRNPDKVIPEVGDLVHLPPKDSLLRGYVRTPQSWALKANETNEQERLAYFKARDRTFRLYSVNWGS